MTSDGSTSSTQLNTVNQPSDEEFSPGQLIIEFDDESSSKTPPGVINEAFGADDFKGLTFVGKMDVLLSNPVDTVCLYSYHWGTTHIDLITRKNEGTIVPIKNIYDRVLTGLTRNTVSNRISKLGAKSVTLSEPYIDILKKLQLPITVRSHYLSVSDFMLVCSYYKKSPPTNLADFVHITSFTNPAEILKKFNSTLSVPILTLPHQIKEGSSDSHLNFSTPLPNKPSVAEQYLHHEEYSKLNHNIEESTIGGPPVLLRSLQFSDGVHFPVIQEGSHFYILNSDLPNILPQANVNAIGHLRSLLNIPLEYASRTVTNVLKNANIVGVKACKIVIFKASDIVKMYNHWNIPVPQYLVNLSAGKFPDGIVDKADIPVADYPGPSLPNRVNYFPATCNARLMSPTGTKVDLGISKKKERKPSHSGFPPLNDHDLEYFSLPWSSDKTLTLLTPPTGEPHVAIAELVDKIFSQRSQVSLQRRTRLGVPTVPATSLQIHALRARGSIDPSSGYSKLIPLSGVIRLAKEAGIFIPSNVLEECQKYVSTDGLKTLLESPIKSINSWPKTPDRKEISPHVPTGSLIAIRPDVASHPDVNIPGKVFRTAEGVLFQVNWDKVKIAVFTSARNISYVGLYQIYDALFKHLVTRMNFKMRMRKLGIKSIRAPSFIRQGLIKLDALPNSSPVCGLLRIFEMEKLVKSYDITPPQVFYDLFLNNSKLEESSEPDDFKDFDNSEEKLVVSFPRTLVNVSEVEFYPKPKSQPVPSLSSKSSILQNLAKKISQKNHRLAAASSSSVIRTCHTCGKNHPLAKKRCENCGSFLTGYPCPNCGVINYSRCSKCIQCGTVLDTNKTKMSSPLKKMEEIERTSIQSIDHHGGSDSSDDSHNPDSPVYAAPPIRNAALKTMFPSQSTSSSGGVVTKTIFSGNLTSSRNCQECGALNPRKAKKCQQCKAPIQGRPCPKCARPNHSHSTECFKCGTTLPPTATKWILGGRIFRTTQDSNRLGMTTKQLRKTESNRAEISCIRCNRVRKYGHFKCGRCGDLFATSPVYNTTAESSKTTSNLKLDELSLFAQNLLVTGVGEELLPTLLSKEDSFRKELYPAEEELNTTEEDYQNILTKRITATNDEAIIQTELDSLVIKIEQLNSELVSIKEKEKEASLLMEICPDQVKTLESKVNAFNDLYD